MFELIGTLAAWRSRRPNTISGRDGFTLLEALVALALLVAFSAALGPYLFQSRRIMVGAESRVRAQMILRSILAGPIDRTNITKTTHEGEINGLRWRWTAEPINLDSPLGHNVGSPGDGNRAEHRSRSNWTTFRVAASVSWGPGEAVSAETVRLGTAE